MNAFLWLFVSINVNHAENPFDASSGNHIHYLQHKFYDLYFFANDTLLEDIKLTNNPNASIQSNLSNTDDVPEIRFDLLWDFKFYGHLHNWITVSPNGFLTTHPVTCWTFCNWWYADSSYRRYIAPLMADFNPSANDYSQILYYIDDEAQSLHIQWHNISLWQPSTSIPLGYNYDFQVQLNADGTIYFYYFNVPKAPDHIQVPSSFYQNYTFNIGLEDAAYQYNADGLYYLYPYAPVTVNVSHALNHRVVVFQPKQTCIDQATCAECQSLATDPGSNLECGWCPDLGLCSDGFGREIYEYTSHEYCTEDEMLHHLISETCTDYVSDTRDCDEHDHVLARYPAEMVQDGTSQFYSGVILSASHDSNSYLIQYDNDDIPQSMVQYSWVHPCSTVSFDYHSYELQPRCVPHCVLSSNKRKSKSRALATSISIIVAVMVVFCACVNFFLYRRRMTDSQNIILDQIGVELEDEHSDSLKLPSPKSGMSSDDSIDDELDIDLYVGQSMSVDDPLTQVSHPIISPAPAMYECVAELKSFKNRKSDMQDKTPSDVEVEELNSIELVSNCDADKNKVKDDNNTNTKGWDMTPLI